MSPSDHVGLEALLEDRVGAAVDADEHGPARPGCRRAAPGGRCGGRCPARRSARGGRGSRFATGGSSILPMSSSPSSRMWLDRVLGEVGERLVDPLALLGRSARRTGEVEHAAPARACVPFARSPPPSIDDRSPSLQLLEQRRAGQRRSGAPRPGRGTADRRSDSARARGRRDVDDRPHPARDQVLGGDPVEVARGR